MKKVLKEMLLSLLTVFMGVLLCNLPVMAAENDEPPDWRANLEFGQVVSSWQGAPYYESADQNGSGKHGFYGCNIYTNGMAYIAGYARLDQDGNILESECYWRESVPEGKKCGFDPNEDIWVALYVDGFTTGSIGWMHIDDILPNPSEIRVGISNNNETILPTDDPINPEDVANAIEESHDSGKKVALLLDASGSVDAYSAEIATYANQVNKADTVLVFATDYAEIVAEDYLEASEDVGGLTEIYAAMNALSGAYDTAIIVTDTYQNGVIDLHERSDIGEVIIVSTCSEWAIDDETVRTITAMWNLEPQIVHLTIAPSD